jgi:S1-C subfamily serine protease
MNWRSHQLRKTQIGLPFPLNRMRMPRRGVLFLAVFLVLSAAIATAQQPTQMRPETVDKVMQATVRLNVTGPDEGQGSGFLIGERLVKTAAHVLGMLSPKTKIEVVVHSGEPNEKHLAGQVVAVDRRADQAVVRVEGGGKLPAPLRVADKLYEGEKVYAFGFPGGSKKVVVSEPSKSSKDPSGALKIQFNGGMHPGSSGGPVTNAKGEVVGVLVEGIKGTPINFASPVTKVQPILANPLLPSKNSQLNPAHNSAASSITSATNPLRFAQPAPIPGKSMGSKK